MCLYSVSCTVRVRVLIITLPQRQASLWFELVPYDEVKGQLSALVQEWVQVAAYQKTLPFKPESSGSQVDCGKCDP